MKILRRLYSALLASDLSRNSSCDNPTVGLRTGLIQNGLIAIIRSTAVVAVSMSLLSGSLALAQTTQRVSLAWDAETDPSVVGYKVHQGTSSGSYTMTQDVGASTTATVPGLTTGKTFYFRRHCVQRWRNQRRILKRSVLHSHAPAPRRPTAGACD